MDHHAEKTGRRPVTGIERLSSVDTVRGVALLGILAVNIAAFALPMEAYMNPMHEAIAPYQGRFEGANRVAWWIMHVFFEQKMMSIFSMLFGAGLVLMAGRPKTDAAGNQVGFAGLYYRRLLVLFVIGMLHAYLIWYGDILVAYSLFGAVLYPLRKWRPGWLITLGLALLVIGSLINLALGLGMNFFRTAAMEAHEVARQGGTLSASQQELLKGYDEMMKGIVPSSEQIAGSVARLRGSLPEVLGQNAQQALFMQLGLFLLWTLWRALGLMLVGMGLMKLGVFSAARSDRFYLGMTLLGLGVGIPLAIVGAERTIASGFDFIDGALIDSHFNYVGSFLTALGYVGAVMLACKRGVLARIRGRLAAVGRMALTNYLMQSLLMTSVFYGWGLGYFASFNRAELWLFVIGVWILQLVISPLWLARYRFGPAEWVWRSLTYMEAQPMRRQPTSTVP